MGVGDVGAWLVEHRAELDRAEAEWLGQLARFDREGSWALDGHLSCASWLVWTTNMARSTAFEKLRVAHELDRRPVIAEAFRDGRLSYSAVRAITRLDRPSSEVDRALVELADSGHASIVDLERVVRSYMLYADQERPPYHDAGGVRDVRIRRGGEGTGQVVITLSDLEIEEFAATLQAFIDLRYRPQPAADKPVDESSAGGSGGADTAVDGSSGGDFDEAPIDEASRPARKADAFMDMVHVALGAADSGHAAGDDRYLVHLVTRDGGRSLTFMDGSPVHPADGAAACCDASTVTHTVAEDGEPLHLGRKTRTWNTAQRRAISVRDGGRCRFPGCGCTYYDIHHLRPWDAGGLTDTANGLCGCRRHHRLLHAGHTVEGDPNGELRFYRPDGTYIGSTYPAARRA
ncbi:MAG: DUF222 domain-containing protein, partial [Acidimicrobiaceae bacterium]|nr:DUF222 domain-containing protein [Acidimicrobiaceae bacterium]